MTWTPLTDEQRALCGLMARWLEIRRQWRPDSDPLPTQADIDKSALFERLRSGKDPLPYPPPRGYSCPWYAAVEDPGPHVIGDAADKGFSWFFPERVADEVVIHQCCYRVVDKVGDQDFILRDDAYDTPYRFRFWWDVAYRYDGGRFTKSYADGAWLLKRIEDGAVEARDRESAGGAG